jgi:hypothetical protein
MSGEGGSPHMKLIDLQEANANLGHDALECKPSPVVADDRKCRRGRFPDEIDFRSDPEI